MLASVKSTKARSTGAGSWRELPALCDESGAAKAAKAVFLALSKPAPYGLNSPMDALIDLRGVLCLIRIAVRARFGPPLPPLPARLSISLR